MKWSVFKLNLRMIRRRLLNWLQYSNSQQALQQDKWKYAAVLFAINYYFLLEMHCFHWNIYQSEYFITCTCITYSNIETKQNRYEKHRRWNKCNLLPLISPSFNEIRQVWHLHPDTLLTLWNTLISSRVLELQVKLDFSLGYSSRVLIKSFYYYF